MKMNYLIGRKGLLLNPLAILLLALVSFLVSCGDDDGDDTGGGGATGEVTAIFGASAEGLTITFSDESVNADTWSWDFGDGNTSTDEDPVHTYEVAGEYQVTLVASNSEDSDEVTETVATQNGGALASKIVGKEWIPARGNVHCYSQGDIGTEFDDQSPGNFSWGDGGSQVSLSQRGSLANDVYTFNIDGTMDVNFNDDFWGEFTLYGDGVEGTYDISDGTLPDNPDGVEMTPFINPDDNWEFAVDEDNATITVNGLGGHILNPRLVYSASGDAVLTPTTSVYYDIVRVVEVEGAADTLVIYAEVNDLQLGHFITLHAYENEADIPPVNCDPERLDVSIAATTIAHDFKSADGSSGLASLNIDYVPTFGEVVDGETCTKFEIWNPDAGNVFGNLFLRSGTSGECEDGTESYATSIDFTGTESVVKFDIFIPTEGNDFTTDLVDELTVRWVDESQHGGTFWQYYVYQVKTGIAMDEWVTVTYDFEDGTALFGIQGADATAKTLSEAIEDGTNVPDALHIDWGGDNHSANGVFYIKDFRIE